MGMTNSRATVRAANESSSMLAAVGSPLFEGDVFFSMPRNRHYYLLLWLAARGYAFAYIQWLLQDQNYEVPCWDRIIESQPGLQRRLENSVEALDDFPCPTSQRKLAYFKPRYLHYLLLYTASGGSKKFQTGTNSSVEEFVREFFQWYLKDPSYDGSPCWDRVTAVDEHADSGFKASITHLLGANNQDVFSAISSLVECLENSRYGSHSGYQRKNPAKPEKEVDRIRNWNNMVELPVKQRRIQGQLQTPAASDEPRSDIGRHGLLGREDGIDKASKVPRVWQASSEESLQIGAAGLDLNRFKDVPVSDMAATEAENTQTIAERKEAARYADKHNCKRSTHQWWPSTDYDVEADVDLWSSKTMKREDGPSETDYESPATSQNLSRKINEMMLNRSWSSPNNNSHRTRSTQPQQQGHTSPRQRSQMRNHSKGVKPSKVQRLSASPIQSQRDVGRCHGYELQQAPTAKSSTSEATPDCKNCIRLSSPRERPFKRVRFSIESETYRSNYVDISTQTTHDT